MEAIKKTMHVNNVSFMDNHIFAPLETRSGDMFRCTLVFDNADEIHDEYRKMIKAIVHEGFKEIEGTELQEAVALEKIIKEEGSWINRNGERVVKYPGKWAIDIWSRFPILVHAFDRDPHFKYDHDHNFIGDGKLIFSFFTYDGKAFCKVFVNNVTYNDEI